MKFKVGEKVKIKKNLKEGYDFKYYVADEMEKFKGKTSHADLEKTYKRIEKIKKQLLQDKLINEI